MPAPATNGKLRTNLADMEIGDYIRCVYEADTAHEAGEFKYLGIDPLPTYTVSITENVKDENGNIVYEEDGTTPKTTTRQEEREYEELPTTPGTTAKGYFYLLKADKGLLIADRMVQSQISWDALNLKGYVFGAAKDLTGGGQVLA